MNPPFSVLLFSLFSLGSYSSGLLFWWGSGFFLFIFSLYLLRQELEGLKVYSMPRLILYSFYFYPVALWFFYGQNTTITFFLYTLFYVSLRKQWDGLAGLAVGLLIYKPQLGIALYLILLCKLRWKSLLTATISAGGCIAAGFAISTNAMIQFLKLSPTLTDMIRLYRDPWDQPPISLSHLNNQIFNSHFNSILSYPTWGVHSLFGFSSLLFDHFSTTLADIVFFLLTVGIGAYFVYLAIKLEWEPRSRQWDLMLSVLFTLGLLLSPHLYAYDLMLLLLPLAIVVHCFPEGRNNRPLDGGVLLVWTVFLYLFCFVGTIFSKWQLEITKYLGFPEFALQINTLVILIWSFQVLHSIERKSLSSEIPE